MRFEILRHVRDHAKAVGPAHHLLLVIATHVNYHTGEARVSVKRLAHALDVTPRHVRRLLARLITSGQLLVQRSRGRHAPNTYRIPQLGTQTTTSSPVPEEAKIMVTPAPQAGPLPQGFEDWQGFAEGNPERDGGVYLLQSEGHYKIGHSRHPKRRLQILTAENAHPVSVVHIIATSQREKLERAFHQLFAHRHERGEWFTLTADEVTIFCRYQRMESFRNNTSDG